MGISFRDAVIVLGEKLLSQRQGKNAFQQNRSRYFELLATEKMQYLPEKNP